MSSDILIIGGGVIGLSIARELNKRGAGPIAVVDRGRIGAEASWAAAGMLAPNSECHADDELFRLCTASNAMYPDFAAELRDETDIDIELDCIGTLSLAFSEDEAAELDARYQWQRETGIAVQKLSAVETITLEPEISPSVHGANFYPNDWQVESRKLIAALRRYCELNRIKLVENTGVSRLIIDGGRATGVETDSDKYRSANVIITAGAWCSELIPTPQVKPIRGQMIGLAGPIPRILHRVIYSPRGYLVPRADGRILVGATVEDVGFSKEVTPDAISSLKAAAIEIAPGLEHLGISEAWAGLRPYVAGAMPVIGRIPDLPDAFIATGHYRNGILLAPITAKMIADEMLGASKFGVPASAS